MAYKKEKKPAKMGHTKIVEQAKKTCFCVLPACKGTMFWARVGSKMKFVCDTCGAIE